MRSILKFGSLAFACFFLGLSARAADFYESYYADENTGENENLISPPEDSSILSEPCGCGCELECFDCCDYYNGRRRLLGMLPSDHCFDSFVSPLSNPFYFEDPRSLTEVRGMFIDNALPNSLSGGDVHVWAAQFRGRVTDRLSIIVPRVGHLQVNEAGGGGPSGFMSTPVGFKYNLVRDVENQFLVSGGITYFIKGSGGALSNFGGGDFNFYLTGGKEIFEYGHWLSATGFRIPTDSNWGTQMWYWSNQWDYEVVDHIYGLVGINWFHWMKSASVISNIPVTGVDLIDIPTNGVAGTNVATALVGVKYKPGPHMELGAGFEFALTDRTDILKNRLYIDAILRY